MSRALRFGAKLPRPLRRWLLRLGVVDRFRRRSWGLPSADRPASGTPRPVVVAPTWLDWHNMRQRPHFLAEALAAAGHDVYFVDERIPSPLQSHGVSVVPDLTAVPGSGALVYLHYAPSRDVAAHFADSVVVYDILDDLALYEAEEGETPPERRVRPHHEALLAEADVVMASSATLVERNHAERADILLVPNGVDVARFGASASRPSDLPPGSPIVGYHGAIAEWLDFDLAAAVAGRMPEWSFVFVGPVRAEAKAAARTLGELPNVTFLGERPSEAMPAYVQAFDVSAIWFDRNAMTDAVSPLKLYEALAAGTPVVSTPIRAATELDSVATAGTADDFETALRASAGTTVEDVPAASWEQRIRPLLEHLEARDLLAAP